MEHFASTTNPSTISSAIPLALAPSVSPLLHLIANTLITWFKITIIMHQAMLLMAQACISPLASVPELTCYSRPCASTGYHQLLYCTLLASRNRVCGLLSQVDDFCSPLITAVLWWCRLLSISWECSVHYLAATGRCWLSQVSDSGPDDGKIQEFITV